MAIKTRQKTFIAKAIAVMVIIWIACLLTVAAQYRETKKMSENIVEIGNSIMSFHNAIHFRSPYRVTHASDMSLSIQLIYSLRVQLEADYQKSWLQPDVTHLIYVVDNYIEKSQLFMAQELGILKMVDQLKKQRAYYASQPELKQYYVEVGAYMFEALFTEGKQGPEIYRALDSIMQESQTLPDPDRQNLQLTLAQASKLLSEYAEGNNLVRQLLQHEIYRELFTVEQQYQQAFSRISLLVFALSMALVMSVIIAVLLRERSIAKMFRNNSYRAAAKSNELQSEPIAVDNNVTSKPMVSEQAESALESKINIQQMLNALNEDSDAVKVLLNVFIEDHSDDAEKLKSLLSSDPEAALRLVHSLKGVTSTLGAVELRAVAVEIEAKIKRAEEPSANDLERLKQHLQQVVKSAEYWLAKDSWSRG